MNLLNLQQEVSEKVMSSALIHALFSQKATRSQYKNYMIDVYHYARHSSKVIAIAGSRLTLSHPEIASYLLKHAQEELGHDRWAFSDLRDLGVPEDEIEFSQPSDACQKMLGLEYLYATHLNALGLFGWLFALESLGGKMGSGIAKQIDKCLDLNGKATYFLSGHGQADVAHTKDLEQVIDKSIQSAQDQLAFSKMVRMSSALYSEILTTAAR